MKKLIIIVLFIYLLGNVSALCEDEQIDINTASARELEKLDGVGEKIAQYIIDARPFEDVNELIDVYRIGGVTLEKIKEQRLACVGEYEDDETQEENTKHIVNETEETKIPETTKINVSERQDEKIEMSPILLNAKDIKSEDNKEGLKDNLALCGIVTFCVIFGALFLLKGKKYKNEFQQ